MNHSTDPFARSHTSTSIQVLSLDTRLQTNRFASMAGETKAPVEVAQARKTKRLFFFPDTLLDDVIQDVRTRAWSKMQNNASSLIRDAQTRVFLPPYFESITPSIFTPPRKSDALRPAEYRTYVIRECFRRRNVERISTKNEVGREAKLECKTHSSPILVGITSRRTHTQNSDVGTKRRKLNKISKLKSRADRPKILPRRSDVANLRQKPPSRQHRILASFHAFQIHHLESATVRSVPFSFKSESRPHYRNFDAETTPSRLYARLALADSLIESWLCSLDLEALDNAFAEPLESPHCCYAFPANVSNLLQIKRSVARPARSAGFQLHDAKRKSLFEASNNWNTNVNEADDTCTGKIVSKYVQESTVDLPESYRIPRESCRSEEFVPRRAKSAWGVTN